MLQNDEVTEDGDSLSSVRALGLSASPIGIERECPREGGQQRRRLSRLWRLWRARRGSDILPLDRRIRLIIVRKVRETDVARFVQLVEGLDLLVVGLFGRPVPFLNRLSVCGRGFLPRHARVGDSLIDNDDDPAPVKG